jgi:hypothetical protein
VTTFGALLYHIGVGDYARATFSCRPLLGALVPHCFVTLCVAWRAAARLLLEWRCLRAPELSNAKRQRLPPVYASALPTLATRQQLFVWATFCAASLWMLWTTSSACAISGSGKLYGIYARRVVVATAATAAAAAGFGGRRCCSGGRHTHAHTHAHANAANANAHTRGLKRWQIVLVAVVVVNVSFSLILMRSAPAASAHTAMKLTSKSTKTTTLTKKTKMTKTTKTSTLATKTVSSKSYCDGVLGDEPPACDLYAFRTHAANPECRWRRR